MHFRDDTKTGEAFDEILLISGKLPHFPPPIHPFICAHLTKLEDRWTFPVLHLPFKASVWMHGVGIHFSIRFLNCCKSAVEHGRVKSIACWGVEWRKQLARFKTASPVTSHCNSSVSMRVCARVYPVVSFGPSLFQGKFEGALSSDKICSWLYFYPQSADICFSALA